MVILLRYLSLRTGIQFKENMEIKVKNKYKKAAKVKKDNKNNLNFKAISAHWIVEFKS